MTLPGDSHPVRVTTGMAPSGIAPAEFARLSALMQQRCGIQLPESKRVMVETRLRKRLQQLGIDSFAAYWRRLTDARHRETELVALTDVLTTNKTEFLREGAHFTLLGESVLPHLYQTGAGVRTPLRVWSAASSTGEEPYTLAMLLDQWGRSRRPFEYSILGTDISTRVLEQARLGAYQERAIAALPESWRQSYLLRARGSSAPAPYRINAALRARVQFGYLNLMDDDYRLPDRYHIIFCRNVLIYFNRPTQAAVIGKLIEWLVPGGYRFVGHSESLQGSDFPLATLVPSVYRHLPAWQSGEMAIRRAS
jgi:chemotaxis protein methyltransferase CheR